MKRISLLLTLAVISLMAIADDGHSVWMGDFIDWNPKQLKIYWEADSFNYTIDDSLPSEGYSINGKTISGGSKTALLYASYELMRQKRNGNMHDVSSAPFFKYRILNHLDNLDGTLGGGFAGKSIFWSTGLKKDIWTKRLEEYARINCSVGINGAIINNAKSGANILTPEYIDTVKAVADVLRQYGIKVYLSVNPDVPKNLGATSTADPLEDSVSSWWKAKVKHIYDLIPDFGGFCVSSDGDGSSALSFCGRSIAECANVFADILKPYGGIVLWQIPSKPSDNSDGFVVRTVAELKKLDGEFRDNVILQSSDGVFGLCPGEPYAPEFDNLKGTSLGTEFHIMQENDGRSESLAYFAPLWKDFFSAVSPKRLVAVVGISNTGSKVNWCGHPFSQANWYAFGRLAWNPNLSSKQIAHEWLRMTFAECDNRYFFDSMASIMEKSSDNMIVEQRNVSADTLGIGNDRAITKAGLLDLYGEPCRSLYSKKETCPERYLLFFHHIGWDYKMKNGRSLWTNLCLHYEREVKNVETTLFTWKLMHSLFVDNDDEDRWKQVDSLLMSQLGNAEEMKDECLQHFQTLSHLPIVTSKTENNAIPIAKTTRK